MDTLAFFRNLKPEDWDKRVTDLWTVKDVLAHLVGWEREVALEFRRTWGTDKKPWFVAIDDYNDFNKKIYN